MLAMDGARSRSALVTGASSGIGEAIAERLLAQGWKVTGLSRSRPKIAHGRFCHVSADLADSAALPGALSGLTPCNALVHAAGFMRVGNIRDLAIADGQAMWRVHVDAAVALVKHFAPAMPDGGRVVFIGSRTSAGAAGRAQYAATKAALVGLARSFAIELAPRGITVNVVSPGATSTPMLDDPSRKALAPHLPPIGRFVRAEEVAALVGFLLSEDAASITGQQIMVCGGASL
jgi:NAD(P)-dependent dehydrogenase (short-subunit alcohol dehydrogenase family)